MATTNYTIHAYLDGKSANLLSNVVRQNWTLDPVTRRFKEELVKGDVTVRAFQFGALELTGTVVFLCCSRWWQGY